MTSSGKNKITVILSPDEFARFGKYCAERGFKKSTLISKLIRDFLDEETKPEEPNLFSSQDEFARAGQEARSR